MHAVFVEKAEELCLLSFLGKDQGNHNMKHLIQNGTGIQEVQNQFSSVSGNILI